ncbi:MAG: DUF424 family protein [Candidatus Bathyarchaeia archaeon]
MEQNPLYNHYNERLKLEVYVNIRKIGNNTLLAICDAEILGKTLHEGKITFHIKEEFYKGSLVSIEEAIALIQSSTIVNMIGKNIVNKAIEKGYVHPEAILNIEGIPHAQIVKL